MNCKFLEIEMGTNLRSWSEWRWVFRGAMSERRYTRRSSAKRGCERFVRHISGKGRA